MVAIAATNARVKKVDRVFYALAMILGTLIITPSVSAEPTDSATERANSVADPSYLFVADSLSIKVKPRGPSSAKVIIEDPAITRFTDRPDRETSATTTAQMLTTFGWATDAPRLRVRPNAAISIAGTSQIVEIRRARIRADRLVLWVWGVQDSPQPAAGSGSIFIDNAPSGYSTPTVAWFNTELVNLVLFALAGPRDGLTLRLVEGATLEQDGTWTGGSTVSTGEVTPSAPTARMFWEATSGTGSVELSLELAVSRPFITLTVDSVISAVGMSQTDSRSTVIPSYWCASNDSCP